MPAPVTRLGIDFGTSNTVAVVRWADGRARPLLFEGSPLLPSAVYAEPSGALTVGRDAVHSARLDPARFEPNPKRRIDDGAVLLGDREVPVVALITAVLSRVSDEYRRTVGQPPAEVTLTCPAAWGATRRLVLADAAAAAGLGGVRVVPEPVAAATYFAQVLGRDVPIGSVVVVYDFGAGTFDASVVARTSTAFEVLAVDGRDDIGGLDIDQAVVALVGEVVAAGDPVAWQRLTSPSTVEERRARRLLWDDARGAKERLSRSPSADLTVPLINSDVHVTREQLEQRARPLLDQTVRVTQGVIRWANLAEGRIAGVFLVGGSSRIPLVATLLHRALGEAPVAIDQPEVVVAEGSMLAGAAPVPASASPAPGPATGRMPAVAVPGAAAGRPVSAPPAGHPRAAPVSGAPSSGAPAAPISGPPVSGGPMSRAPMSGAPMSGAPVSGPPVSAPPVSAPPVSAPPVSGPPVSPAPGAAARSVGRVVVPGAQPPGGRGGAGPVTPTRPLPQTGPPAYPVRRAPLQPVPSPAPAYTLPAGSTYAGGEAAGAGTERAVRVLVRLLVALLLVLVPLVAGYVAYKQTVGEDLWPMVF